jgi:hypothetical protein
LHFSQVAYSHYFFLFFPQEAESILQQHRLIGQTF